MPELPEVEITRRRIEPLLLERQIARVKTTRDSYFFLTKPKTLRRALPGRRVTAVTRQGKYLIADLDNGQRLLLHLGMTGQFFGAGATSVRLLSSTQRAALSPETQVKFEPDEHTHLQLWFDDAGPAVFFRDVRKFGKVRLLKCNESDPRLDRLGIDALKVSGEDLFRASKPRKAAIKNLLLDQSVCAGIGNIYADEALFISGVRPTRRAFRMTRSECNQLATNLQRVLSRSIETGGASISDFVGPDGEDGHYQDETQVYGRTGKPCHHCATTIRRTVLAQRGTHYCPSCQR